MACWRLVAIAVAGLAVAAVAGFTSSANAQGPFYWDAAQSLNGGGT
jgi:hypothetical protein